MKLRPFYITLLAISAIGITNDTVRAQAWGKDLYWDPNVTNTTNAGGSGNWNLTDSSWFTNPGRLTWSSTTTLAIATSSTVGLGYTNIYFGGNAQSSPYTLNIASTISSIGASHTLGSAGTFPFNMYFQGDYDVQTLRGAGLSLGGSGAYVYTNLYASAGKTVNFGGNGNAITITGAGNNSSTPSVLFAGGGAFVLKNNVSVNQSNGNGRVTVGTTTERTSLTLDHSTSGIVGSRLYVDNGIFTLNGGTVTLNNALTSSGRSGLQIGVTTLSASNTPSIFNMNGGSVTIVVSNTDSSTNLNHGIVIGGNGSQSGGTLNLNGGLLTVQDVLSGTGSTSEFIFNGGTLAVSNAANQAQLNAFMSGFTNTATNRIVTEAGGAFIDTSNINALTNGKAVISSVISGSGGLTKTGNNTLVLTATNTYTGLTTVAGGTLQLGNNTAGGVIAGDLLNNGTVVFDRTAFYTYGGVISGTGALVKENVQTLYLQGTNSYTGGTVVNAGSIRIDYDVNLGDVSSALTLNSGTLRVTNQVDAVGIATTRLLRIGAGGATIQADKFVNWDGLVTGTGAFTKIGASTVSLNNASNDFVGDINVNTGILRIRAGDGSLGASGNDLTFANNTTFRTQSVVSSSLTDINASRSATLNGEVTFDTITALQWNGEISGAGSLIKSGTGTFRAAGVANYVGQTTVSEGTLLINGDFSGATGGVVVGSGAVLAGTGTTGSAVSVAGIISAGDGGMGLLSTGSLGINSGGSVRIELGRSGGVTVSDRINVTGSVTLDSGANLELSLLSGLDRSEVGDIFWLLNNDGGDAISGLFASLNGVATNLSEGASFEWDSRIWQITYQANFSASSFTGGNDLAILTTSVVPEPGTWAMLGLGMAFLLIIRNRRRVS